MLDDSVLTYNVVVSIRNVDALDFNRFISGFTVLIST